MRLLRRVRFLPAAICVSLAAMAPVVAGDLVLLDVADRDGLVERDLPVVWKGAGFLLAEWDEALQQIAREAGIHFRVLERDLAETQRIRILETGRTLELPEPWSARAVARIGRKSIALLDAREAAEPVPQGFSVLDVPRRTRGWNPRGPRVAYDCSFDPLVADLIQRTDQAGWLDWIEKLSGAEPLVVSGGASTVQTRYSPSLFDGDPTARAYDYALEQLAGWHFGDRLEEHPYDVGGGDTWKNLVVTIPGASLPDEIVLLTAHLDSMNQVNPAQAPGANDNGTGVATLLEAARILRQLRFDRTIQIVWFTGEEQFLLGSEAFVADYPVENFLGVVNLDMFGWDGDGDRCFEIHAGTLPDSIDVAECFADSIVSYGLGLDRDFLTTGATDRSDHASFWQVDVGAIEIAENFFWDGLPDGCSGQDANPAYHTASDTVAANLMPTFAFDIARTGLATLAAMALPIESCFTAPPVLTATPGVGSVQLVWSPISGAASYRIQRSIEGCHGQWLEIAQTTGSSWIDVGIDEAATYSYRVEAVAADGFCVSAPSNCAAATPTVYHAIGDGAALTDVCAGGGPGSGDGTLDPGESALMAITLTNDGNAALVDLGGTLSVLHPSVQVIDAHADWPELEPQQSAASLPNHVGVQVATGAFCGTSTSAALILDHEHGGNATYVPLTIGAPYEDLLLEEDFAGGIPPGWTVVDGGDGGGAATTWTAANPGGRSIDPPFDAPFVIADSDSAGSSASQDEELISPAVDATGCLGLTLEFASQYRWYSGSEDELADVDVSTNGGQSWINVLRLQGASDGYPTPVTKSVDLTAAAAANPTAVTLRFHYHQASYEWWWAVDEVKLRCERQSCTPCPTAPGPPGEAGQTAPLVLDRDGDWLLLSWGGAATGCAGDDHAVYRGELGSFDATGYTHDVTLECSTGTPALAVSLLDPRLGPADYFLVTSDNGVHEGSYGRGSDGRERPASVAACHAAQNLVECGP